MLLAMLGTMGCGKENWGYVTGTVTLDGQPVGPGTITFSPKDEQSSGAMAQFGEDGKFTVKSSGNKEGAPVNEYHVLIYGQGEDEFASEQVQQGTGSPIPRRYSVPGRSGLEATVKPGKNAIDFRLEST